MLSSIITTKPKTSRKQTIEDNASEEQTARPVTFSEYKDELLRYVITEENKLHLKLASANQNTLNLRQNGTSIESYADNGGEHPTPTEKAKVFDDVSWPDPDPRAGSTHIFIDDVTHLNSAPIEGIFFPRNIKDVKRIIALARKENRKVSIRGTKHSMGGHTIAKQG